MNDPMRILKADHREVERLLKQLSETDEGTEREQLADEVATKLAAHMEIEESIVYPPIGDAVGDDDREEAEVEHRLARQGVETMLSMVDQPGFGAAVEMLSGGIHHHVEEEESQLLPDLKDALSRDEWEAMGDAIAAAKEAAGMPVPSPTPRRSSKRRGGRAKSAGERGKTAKRSTAKKSAGSTTAQKSTRKSPSKKASSSRSGSR